MKHGRHRTGLLEDTEGHVVENMKERQKMMPGPMMKERQPKEKLPVYKKRKKKAKLEEIVIKGK